MSMNDEEDRLTPTALERFGIEWRGPHMPIARPTPDGYWTPWHEATTKIEQLRGTLAELAALVRGECPALLNEDSGGDARLSMEIDELLREQGGY